MTYNEFILCITCNKCINLRIQMGNFSVPFSLVCPECKTNISGQVDFEPFKLNLKNATRLENDRPDYDELTQFPIWCLEISSDFPTQKLRLRKSALDSLTPFLSQISRFDKKEYFNDIKDFQSTLTFAEFIQDGDLENYYRLYNLYWGRQDKYLYHELEELLDKYTGLTPINKVYNRTDATMALHQLLLTISGISSVIGKNVLSEYTELGKKIQLSELHRNNILSYTNYIEPNFDKIEKSAFENIITFSKIYHTLIPIVTLNNIRKYDRLDQERYGISASNYKEMKEFYASSYEWILDNINIVIGLNNIFVRNSYTECCNNKNYCNDLEKIGSKFNKINSKSSQKPYFDISEPFSKPMSSLTNRIRNAIQHYSSEVNYDKQEIIFEDKYKGKVRIERCSIVDFAQLCLSNFSLIFYILEIVYTLRKLKLITDGIGLTIINDREKKDYEKGGFRKVGNEIIGIPRHVIKIKRNDKCPCGSGLKYKKCCGMNRL
ncbi:YecA family protein [Streptococcus tangpeifui]|uniref:YecA family protein n=1 Tax=Streptococcus tangpeifui TaxID=2709400 RepID=UPI0013EB473E|nr:MULTISPECIES: SEC-C metal-binding domain-containing protein [unclassified Streptococcus]